MRIASLTILCLALALPAWAASDNDPINLTGRCSPGCGCYCPPESYDNGPINGTTSAWTINFGYIVSDTFVVVVPGGGYAVRGFSFGAWEFPGDRVSSVGWAITSAPLGSVPPNSRGWTIYGTGTASVTDQFISTNQYGYNIDEITVTGIDVSVTSGATYWLNLQNAIVPSGDPVYWDENSGHGCGGTGGGANCPSKAFQSGTGTVPSEAFTVSIQGASDPSDTPEPSSILLFGSGVLGILGVVRSVLVRHS